MLIRRWFSTCESKDLNLNPSPRTPSVFRLREAFVIRAHQPNPRCPRSIVFRNGTSLARMKRIFANKRLKTRLRNLCGHNDRHGKVNCAIGQGIQKKRLMNGKRNSIRVSRTRSRFASRRAVKRKRMATPQVLPLDTGALMGVPGTPGIPRFFKQKNLHFIAVPTSCGLIFCLRQSVLRPTGRDEHGGPKVILFCPRLQINCLAAGFNCCRPTYRRGQLVQAFAID